jgi:hypothetical protein
MTEKEKREILDKLSAIDDKLEKLVTEVVILKGKVVESLPDAPEPLPKWVQYDDESIFCVKCKAGDHYYFTDGTHVDISDCTPVRVIPEEKWEALEVVWDIPAVQSIANGETGGAWLADENVTRVCLAIKQLMEEEV